MKAQTIRKIINPILPTLIISFFVTPALPDVNMKDGSFFKNYIDVEFKKHKITRTYNSRSLYRGHFGKGWCSNIDRAIDSSNPERVLLVDCSIEKDVQYVKEFSTEQVRQGGTFNINRSPQSETIFYTHPETGEKLLYQDNQYIRHSLDGSTYKFNSKGQLIELITTEGLTTQVEYEGVFLANLILGTSRWKVLFDRSQKLIRGFESGSTKIQYAYEEGMLTGHRNKTTQRYAYNSFDNLIQIKQDEVIVESIRYDDSRDLVTQVWNKNGCMETYSYNAQNINEVDRYTTRLTRDCQGVKLQYAYEFHHKYRPDGVKFLEFMRVQNSNQSVTEIYYHPQLGYPVLVNTKK